MKLTTKQKRRLAATLQRSHVSVDLLTADELRLNLMNCIDTIEAMDKALHAGAETIVSWRAKPL